MNKRSNQIGGNNGYICQILKRASFTASVSEYLWMILVHCLLIRAETKAARKSSREHTNGDYGGICPFSTLHRFLVPTFYEGSNIYRQLRPFS